jgi:cell division transport system permease protein
MKASNQIRSKYVYYPWWQLFFVHHKQACRLSVQRLLKEPIANMMIITIIAIALALPTSLLLLLSKAKQFSDHWQQQSQITVYLNRNLTSNHIQQLQQQLRINPMIADVKTITPDEGLQQLQERIGLKNLNDFLTNNPLPVVFILTPVISQQNNHAMQHLQAQFSALPEVELVQLDSQWLQRWYGLLTILHKLLTILASIFAIGVVLAIGNAVRLTTERYRKQIDLLQLLGATQRYIKRPFVYTGIAYGIGGAIFAWIILQIVIISLRSSINPFIQTYNPHWHLSLISINTLGWLLLFGLSLGWFGSLMSLRRYLYRVQP